VVEIGVTLIKSALQLAEDGLLAKEFSALRINTNLNVVVEAARFCAGCLKSDHSEGKPTNTNCTSVML